MSGSGGSGYNGGGHEEEPDCGDIVEKTVLNSPVPDVLDQVKVGDALSIEVKNVKGTKIVVAVLKKRTAGSITIANLHTLINCIEAGHRFMATVQQIRSGRCEVLVKAANAK